MTLPKTLLLLAEVIVFAILAVVVSSHFGLADGVRVTVAYLAAYLTARIVLTRARHSSLPALVILLALTVFLIWINYKRLLHWTFFDEYSLEEPNLVGDGRSYYKWALNKYDGRVPPARVIFPGYPMLILALWKVLGVNVVWPQALNMLFTLCSVVLTGMTTRRLLAHRVTAHPATLLWCGMALTCLLMYYFVMGTAVLKEASIFIAIAMAGFALAAMGAGDSERHHPWRDMALFAAACLLLALVRTTYIYFIAVGVAVMALSRPRRDWPMLLAMVAIIVVALLVGNQFSRYSFSRHVEIAGGGWNMQRFYVTSESQRFYHYLLNYYFLYSPGHKVLMLPLTMGVQFIIPLPWNYYENPLIINRIARMTYGWYIVGGTALFYYLLISWRRNANMGCWAWWPALSFAAMAYVMAGSVARYVTPIQPLFVPVAVYVLCRVRQGHDRRAFGWWCAAFVLLLAVALCFCLEIQQATFSKMLHTQSLVNYLQGRAY